MNLQELSDAYNALRNDALGRGLTPNVPAVLAARVGNTFDRFKTYLGNASVLDDITADATARGWVDEYRALAKDVQAAGVKLSAPLSKTFGETVTQAGQQLSAAASKGVLVAVGIAGLALVVYLSGAARRTA